MEGCLGSSGRFLPEGGHFRAVVGPKKGVKIDLVREIADIASTRPQLSGD